MKDAWDRLRQCISPSSTMSHYSNNTLPILNQMFHFVYGSLAYLSPSSTVFSPGQSCSQADPKSITFAIMQQQQRAEVIQIFLLYDKLLIDAVCCGPKMVFCKELESLLWSTNSVCFDQMRLEALCQMSAFLSKMEEKSCESTASNQFPALLQSVQLQFLSGCFALGTQIIGSHSANYETQHYMVHLIAIWKDV